MPGAELVASYDNGVPLVVTLTHRKIVLLNFYPPSSKVLKRGGGWNQRTDGHKLIVNSIAYVARDRLILHYIS